MGYVLLLPFVVLFLLLFSVFMGTMLGDMVFGSVVGSYIFIPLIFCGLIGLIIYNCIVTEKRKKEK